MAGLAGKIDNFSKGDYHCESLPPQLKRQARSTDLGGSNDDVSRGNFPLPDPDGIFLRARTAASAKEGKPPFPVEADGRQIRSHMLAARRRIPVSL
ncbi:MAG: hypothetical protein ACKVX9_19030 [Blastocatellia bacterium]